ncbi:Hypothetical predicted protein [Cloeon dipterum]|uniref:Pleiotrophin/Midkine C-terminal domain-containing protein n=1 Tax=Cloeon dipterum TaxID=197152 RepID=A0A8S1CYI1_9INSE|nr:Hypothetical predicted protein [Cloeon dipterum]
MTGMQVLLTVSLLVLATSGAAPIERNDSDRNLQVFEERQKREVTCKPSTDERCTSEKPAGKENPKKRVPAPDGKGRPKKKNSKVNQGGDRKQRTGDNKSR